MYDGSSYNNKTIVDFENKAEIIKYGLFSEGIGVYMKYNEDTINVYVNLIKKDLLCINLLKNDYYIDNIIFYNNTVMYGTLESNNGYWDYYTIIYDINTRIKKYCNLVMGIDINNNKTNILCNDGRVFYIKDLNFNTILTFNSDLPIISPHADNKNNKILYCQLITKKTI